MTEILLHSIIENYNLVSSLKKWKATTTTRIIATICQTGKRKNIYICTCNMRLLLFKLLKFNRNRSDQFRWLFKFDHINIFLYSFHIVKSRSRGRRNEKKNELYTFYRMQHPESSIRYAVETYQNNGNIIIYKILKSFIAIL